MDYLKAKQYLAEMPMPVFFVSIKSGRIVFANNQAAKLGLLIDVSFFHMLEKRVNFSLFIKEDESKVKSSKKLKLRINNILFAANVFVSRAIFGDIKCLLITLSLIEEVSQNETATVSKICNIFTGQKGKKESYEFLATTAQSVDAFCAALYEKRNNRYVIKEEWRERKSVCIPLLYPDFEKHTTAEIARLGKLKRAIDTAHLAYKKTFGTLGVIIYFFDENVSAKKRQSIENYVNIFRVLSGDIPKNSKLAIAKKGINSLSHAFVIWEAGTRKLLFENSAYRAMFGFINADSLTERLGYKMERKSKKTQVENYTDSKGRYYSAQHTRARLNGKEIVATMITDITKFKQAENKLDTMANTDALTGLLNRRAGIEYLRQIYTKSKAENEALTVCFADIDGLKYINDTYGHGAGDSMIKSVADVLKKHVGKIGTVYRLGGDEFVLILPGINKAQAAALAVQIGKAAAACLVGESQGISMSFGFKEAEYKQEETAGTLISTADFDMYQEKRKKSSS